MTTWFTTRMTREGTHCWFIYGKEKGVGEEKELGVVWWEPVALQKNNGRWFTRKVWRYSIGRGQSEERRTRREAIDALVQAFVTCEVQN